MRIAEPIVRSAPKATKSLPMVEVCAAQIVVANLGAGVAVRQLHQLRHPWFASQAARSRSLNCSAETNWIFGN